MKRFTKICLIIAAVVGTLGLGLSIAGLVLGVTAEDFQKANLSWDLSRKGIIVAQRDLKNVKESFDHVESLELDVAAADVTIEEAEIDKVTVIGSKVYSSFQCRMEGSTLKVEDRDKKYIRIGFLHKEDPGTQITIRIPKGTTLRNMDLEVHAGVLQAEGFRTKTLELNCGAGSAVLEGIVEGESELECGMGEMTFTGRLGGKSSIECGMGSATLTLENKQSDFNYDLECGMGEISVGENSIGGIGGEQKIDTGADKQMRINCGMGSVDVVFEN